ncbi:MAG: protein involved in polysaccharide export with SLBB domain [Arenicella sp.]|jgi:protein involved in polysaccharide export with SLBB domain
MIESCKATPTSRCAPMMLLLYIFSYAALAQISLDYKLGVGDTVKIVVFEEPDMSFDVTVDNSGMISYPYLDEVTIIGKTTSDIESELIKGLKGRILVNPNIAVSVAEYRPFSIGGEVNSPGNYPFEPNLTLRKAINIAGGVTEWSNGKRFTVEREKKLESERLDLDSGIYPGDVVTILPRRF